MLGSFARIAKAGRPVRGLRRAAVGRLAAQVSRPHAEMVAAQQRVVDVRTHEFALAAAAARVSGRGGGMRGCLSPRARQLLLLIPLAVSSLCVRVPLLLPARTPARTAAPCDAVRGCAQFLTHSGAVVRHVRIAPMRHAFSIW